MADVVWPLALQQYVDTDSFQFQIGGTTIRSENDIGPAKVRRRMTKSVDVLVGTIWVTKAEYEIVYNLFDIDLNGGAGVLVFPHPITRAPIRVRFTQPPVFGYVGYDDYSCQLVFEVLP